MYTSTGNIHEQPFSVLNTQGNAGESIRKHMDIEWIVDSENTRSLSSEENTPASAETKIFFVNHTH